MRLRPSLAVLALCACCVLAATHARAQQLEAAVHLSTGFIPDPAALQGRASGARPAATLAEHCTGFVGASPSHVLSLDTRFGYLRIFATAEVDLVLAVRNASGEWMCSGDRFGTHPAVEGLFQRGRVEVWVGTEQLGASGEYSLRITETRSIRPGVGSEASSDEAAALARDLGLEIEATEGLHQGIRTRRGFLPDPRWLDGVAGGTLDAGALGGSCRGFVTARPTHVVTLLTPFDFLQLYLDVDPEEERRMTIVVLAPDGRFLCDVGTRATPDVSAEDWAEGVYRVWVGTLEEDTTRSHRLGISEIRRAR
jgi:hypothetical protein